MLYSKPPPSLTFLAAIVLLCLTSAALSQVGGGDVPTRSGKLTNDSAEAGASPTSQVRPKR